MNTIARFALTLLVCLLSASVAFSSGTKKSQRTKKPLPLDGVPGVDLKNKTNSKYLPDRVIIKLMPQARTSLSKSSLGVSAIDQALSRFSVASVTQMFPQTTLAKSQQASELSLFYSVVFSSPNDPFDVAEQLSQLDEVQYAEPWFIYPVSERVVAPNDQYYGAQWALRRINAEAAWQYSQGDSTILIGIVDTGVELTHPDLAANIWTNPGEIPNNGIDDDGNGLIDDVHGWDFVGADYINWYPDNNPSPTDFNNAHGTHVAGIAAAVTGNQKGVASIAPRCKILPVKVTADNDYRAQGNAYILRGYSGIVYAAIMGAKVINCSWGGGGGSQFEQDIINFATQEGSLVVAAAGNDNCDAFFSPAGYTNVLSVAATDSLDYKAGFSNYGDLVDVSSPGVFILSSVFPQTYAYWSGTSMATPLVTGLAGVVKARFPYLSPVQIGEQIRVTSDNIDGSNPFFANTFGHGRINALKAVTDSTLPSVRIVRFSFSDIPGGNGDGQGQPAETLNISCLFRNYLRPTSPGATVQLTSVNGYMTVLSNANAFPLSSLGTMDSLSNAGAPFRIVISPNVPQSYNAVFQLTYTDGSFTDTQRFSFLVNPTFATHNINAVQLTLTNDGKIGFFDFPANTLGVGFVFNGVNHLFEGGLIIGTSSTKVVDVVRNESGGQDADLSTSDYFSLKTPGIISDQDGHTSFVDAASGTSVGVKVDLDSYAFSDPAEDKYIILSYTIKNTSADTLKNLYAGIFLDWDIGDYSSNISSYDVSRNLGYAYDASSARKEYLGIRALDGAASYRSLLNDGSINLSKAGKWDWMSGGIFGAPTGPWDIHHVISSGPFQIAPSSSQRVGFALVAGDSSLANIQQNADAAKSRWIAITTSVENIIVPSMPEFRLQQNYPNPFNPVTTLEFQIPAAGFVSLKIFDLLGKEITTLQNGELGAGIFRVRWDAHALPSGIYFYRLQYTDRSGKSYADSKKLILIR